ncbi:MAG: Dihydropteroate synthase-related protein [Phormidesmis priestleyi Ana]|uniref:Dihydropteroate synthase-related protein n=1 Tax=Phormidesmis priestleyi Ana TaxID=1666911 RepID=A0A0P8BST8_9CYAN|nr:MAG: Dihydropteroate synthase-related protein [Phormidesmis priestleyi Ana]
MATTATTATPNLPTQPSQVADAAKVPAQSVDAPVDAPVDAQALAILDNKLSKRFIELDPDGYFLIYIDREAKLLCAKHFTNTINDKGLACDPETGEPLCVNGSGKPRQSEQLFTGRTAKELCMKIFEDKENSCPISYLDHAAYLGREFVRAEIALIEGTEYIQD